MSTLVSHSIVMMMNSRQLQRKSGNHNKLITESIAIHAAHATHTTDDLQVQLGKSCQLTATAQNLNVSDEKNCRASNAKVTKTMKTKTKVANLNAKMINDVSKTISDDKSEEGWSKVKVTTSATPATPTTSTCDSNNDLIVKYIADFPINADDDDVDDETNTGKSDKKHNNKNNIEYNDNNNEKTATFADASKMRNPTNTILMKRPPPRIKGESAVTATATPTTWASGSVALAVSCELTALRGEKISPVSETTTTTAMTPTKRISETKSRATSALDTKKSQYLSKNKCPANAAHEISSTRAAIANTTSASRIYGRNYSTTTTTHTNKWQQASTRCELLESNDRKQTKTLPKKGTYSPTTTTTTTTNTTTPSVLSLAEQKAKLRSDFFKDIAKSAKSAKAPKTETPVAAVQADREQSSASSKRLLKRCTNLKLKISKGNKAEEQPKEKPIEPTVLEPIKLSLVEERKLKLTRKFEIQTAIKTASSQREQPLPEFRRVAQLVKKFDRNRNQRKMIVNPNKSLETQDQQTCTLKPDVPNQRHSSPLSDEGCNLGQSPYSTDDEHDNEDNVSIRTASTTIETMRINTKSKDKVARSASSDSALGLEVDDPMDATHAHASPAGAPPIEQLQKRRMTLTVTDLPLRPALLPLAEPTTLPDSPTPELQQTLQNLLSQTSVPTKVILEERVVEIPEDPLRSPVPPAAHSLVNSRRESEQSCFGDFPFSDAQPGVRYVRTPSVVVSDYSDDVMCGITLEEIEYFRAQRLRRRSSLDVASAEREGDTQSDVSASSSCSNLYYCGSTISALDGAECLVNGIRIKLERKISDCSTCSASGNEDETTSTSSSAFTITEDNSSRDIADLLAAQHLSSKRAKKVGGANALDLYDNRI